MRGIRAVIFDLDGTLIYSDIDFAGMKMEIVEMLSERYSLPSIDPGLSTVDIVREALEAARSACLSEEDVENILEGVSEIMDRYEKSALGTVRLVEGADSTLERLKRRGFKIGVLTRSSYGYALGSLGLLGVLSYVDAVEARGDLLEAKPHRSAMVRICRKLGVEPPEAVFVGDHPIDLACAYRCNVRFILFLSRPDHWKGGVPGNIPIVRSLPEIEGML